MPTSSLRRMLVLFVNLIIAASRILFISGRFCLVSKITFKPLSCQVGEYGELLMPANGRWDLNLARLWE